MHLSESQKEQLRQFEATMTEKNYVKREGFFKKVRDIFGV